MKAEKTLQRERKARENKETKLMLKIEKILLSLEDEETRQRRREGVNLYNRMQAVSQARAALPTRIPGVGIRDPERLKEAGNVPIWDLEQDDILDPSKFVGDYFVKVGEFAGELW